MNETNHNIGIMLIYKYILKTIRLSFFILFSSYFLGVLWLILCEFEESIDDIRYIDQIKKAEHDYEERFLVYFGLVEYEQQPTVKLITVTYFAFTSLSTVGFGDYHPRSDLERASCAFILLFGVAIFSIIMGSFTEILEEFQNFNKDIDDGDNLRRFFNLLQKYNNREPMDLDLKRRIEAHFDYKWKYDKNSAFSGDDEERLYDELPEEVQVSLCKNFLYRDFLHSFRRFFSIPNKLS